MKITDTFKNTKVILGTIVLITVLTAGIFAYFKDHAILSNNESAEIVKNTKQISDILEEIAKINITLHHLNEKNEGFEYQLYLIFKNFILKQLEKINNGEYLKAEDLNISLEICDNPSFLNGKHRIIESGCIQLIKYKYELKSIKLDDVKKK